MLIAEQFLLPMQVEERPRPFEIDYPEEAYILFRFFQKGGILKWVVFEDSVVDFQGKPV